MSTSWYLTEQRRELQDTARHFAMDEVLPLANELDPQKADIPRSFLDRMGEMGYFGITLPTDVGGMGLGVFEYCLIAEELARAWMSTASIIARAQGMGTQIGDERRRRELLERSARGQWIGAVALSEPNAGSDLANVQCRATPDGDEWVIHGEKRWCGNARSADFIQLLARTRDPEPGEHRGAGLATFIIEKERDAFPDGLRGEPIDKIGYHGITTFHLWFDGLRVPDVASSRRRHLAATRQQSIFAATQAGSTSPACTPRRGRSASPAAHWRTRSPTARSASSSSGRSLTSRRSGSRSPTWPRRSTPRGRSRGRSPRPWTTATRSRRRRRWPSSLPPRWPCESPATRIQIHGGNGYTTERQVERYWRDARLTTIFEGTSEIQRRTISDRLLGGSP